MIIFLFYFYDYFYPNWSCPVLTKVWTEWHLSWHPIMNSTLLWISFILPFATLVGTKRRRRATELMTGLGGISVLGEDSGLVQIGEKGVKGDLIAPCIFLRRRSREGDVGLFFLWYGKWEQIKVGPGRFRSGDFSSPRWWSNTGAACPEKWSKCQTCQCLRAFGLYILTFGQHWIGQTVGLDDHCRFLMTEIIYFILKSLQVNPDQHFTWD